MRFDLVGRAVRNVNAPAVRSPPGDAGSEVLVGVSDAAVVFFLVLILRRVRSGITAQPELFDERVTLFVIRQLFEGCELFWSNDPAHILVEPLLVSGAQFLLHGLGIGLLLFLREWPLQGIHLLLIARLSLRRSIGSFAGLARSIGGFVICRRSRAWGRQ